MKKFFSSVKSAAFATNSLHCLAYEPSPGLADQAFALALEDLVLLAAIKKLGYP